MSLELKIRNIIEDKVEELERSDLFRTPLVAFALKLAQWAH